MAVKIRLNELLGDEIECDTIAEAALLLASLDDFMHPVIPDGNSIVLRLRCCHCDARGIWKGRNVTDARRMAKAAGWWVAWPVWKSTRARCPLHLQGREPK